MQKEKIIALVKWVTVIVLGLSGVFFFLPYRGNITPLQAFDAAFKIKATDLIIEGALNYILPVLLTLIAAVVMLPKYKTSKSVVSAVLCLLALLCYSTYYGSFSKDYMGVSIGLTLNLVVTILGAVLSISNIVVQKVFATKE